MVLGIQAVSWLNACVGFISWFLMTYLTDVWGLSIVNAAAITNVFDGLLEMLPVIVRFLANISSIKDKFLVALSTVTICLASWLLWSSTPIITGPCKKFESECIGDTQHLLFFISLALIVIGGAALEVSAWRYSVAEIFAAMSFSDNFSAFCGMAILKNLVDIGIITTLLVALFLTSWLSKFTIPAVLILLLTIEFFAFSRSWNTDNQEPGIRFTIAETRTLVKKLPVMMVCVFCGIVMSVANTYYLEQAHHLNRKIGKITVSPQMFLLVYYIGGWLSNGYRLSSPRDGIATAMILSVASFTAAALTEMKRLDVAEKHGLIDNADATIPLTVFIVVPQFLLLGACNGLLTNCLTAYLGYDVENENAHGIIPLNEYAVLAVNGVRGSGITGGVLSAFIVGKVSEKGGRKSWFQHGLNKSRLDRYYWVMTGLSGVNLVMFILVEFLTRLVYSLLS